jgi:DNA ligase (NAD+)
VAELEPVPLAGSVISRATLHNEDEIRRKDIRVGDLVEIKKAGEVIPAVISVNLAARLVRDEKVEPYDMFKSLNGKCPSCEGLIVRDPQFVAWRCDNLQCPAQNTRRLRYFASRDALDLQTLGDVVAEALVEQGLIKEPIDLFSLEKNKLLGLNIIQEDKTLATEKQPILFDAKEETNVNDVKRSWGKLNALKLLKEIEKSKEKPLDRWLCALGIPEVGATGSRDLAACHRDLEHVAASEILRAMQRYYRLAAEKPSITAAKQDAEVAVRKAAIEQEMAAIVACLQAQGLARPSASAAKGKDKDDKDKEWLLDFGPKLVDNVIAYFATGPGAAIMVRLRELGINPVAASTESPFASPGNPVSGRTFVLTGTLQSLDRAAAGARIRALGGTVSESVSKKTSYLVAGAETGARKTEQAEKNNVPIIDEAQFLALIQQTETAAPVAAPVKEEPLLSAVSATSPSQPEFTFDSLTQNTGEKMSEIVFRVQGSEAEPYRVSFAKNGDNLTARCTCRAGYMGQFCKHRLDILCGDTGAIVSDNLADVTIVTSWLTGSDVEAALHRLAAAEATLAKAQAEVSGLKKALAKKLLD